MTQGNMRNALRGRRKNPMHAGIREVTLGTPDDKLNDNALSSCVRDWTRAAQLSPYLSQPATLVDVNPFV